MIQAKRYRSGLAAMTLAVHKRRIFRPASGTNVIPPPPPPLWKAEGVRVIQDWFVKVDHQDETDADMQQGHPRSYGCRRRHYLER